MKRKSGELTESVQQLSDNVKKLHFETKSVTTGDKQTPGLAMEGYLINVSESVAEDIILISQAFNDNDPELSKGIDKLINQAKNALTPEVENLVSALLSPTKEIVGSKEFGIAYVTTLRFASDSELKDIRKFIKAMMATLKDESDVVIVDTLPVIEDGEVMYKLRTAENVRCQFYHSGFRPLSLDSAPMGAISNEIDLTGSNDDFDDSVAKIEVSGLLLNKLQKLAQRYFSPGFVKDKNDPIIIGRMNTYAKITNPSAHAALRNSDREISYDGLMAHSDKFLLPIYFED